MVSSGAFEAYNSGQINLEGMGVNDHPQGRQKYRMARVDVKKSQDNQDRTVSQQTVGESHDSRSRKNASSQ